MITIPTYELTGLIRDVIGFSPDAKHPDAGVLIQWDGERLIVAAQDTLSGGQTSWDCEVEGDGEDDVTTALGTHWGDDGDTATFRAFVHLADAKEIVKVFSLPFKRRLTPVTLDVNTTGTKLFVERKRQDWCTAHTMRIDLADSRLATGFADIEAVVGNAVQNAGDVEQPGVRSYQPSRLAQFGAVRAYGPARMYYLGETALTGIRIGDSFVGYLFPAGVRYHDAALATKALTTPAEDVLRDGTEVLTGGAR